MILQDKNLTLIYHQRLKNTAVNGNNYKKEGQRIWCCSKSRSIFHNGSAGLYCCVELSRSGCSLYVFLILLQDQLVETCWREINHWFLFLRWQLNMEILGNLWTALPLLKILWLSLNCVDIELQTSAFTLQSPHYLTLRGSQYHL